MATRQYIGARYVPKFFENPNGSYEWIEGISYEPLTIVKFAGNTFTSRKPVPSNIGTPNINTEYWVNTGTTTADVAAIQKEIDGINKTIFPINKKYVFVTDSYGNFKYNNKNYVQIMCECAGISSDRYTILTKGGLGFAPTEYRLLDYLQENENALDQSYTDMYIFLGANDIPFANTSNDIRTRIKEVMEYLHTTYPKMQVHLGFVSKNFKLQNYSKFFQTYKEYQECTKYGCEYMINTECIMNMLSDFTDDLIHPTEEAVKYIGETLGQWVIYGEGNVFREKPITISPVTDGVTIVQQGIKLRQINQMYYIVCNEQVYGMTFDYSLTNTTNVKFTLSDFCLNTNNVTGLPIFMISRKKGVSSYPICYNNTLNGNNGNVMQWSINLFHSQDVDQFNFIPSGMGCIFG